MNLNKVSIVLRDNGKIVTSGLWDKLNAFKLFGVDLWDFDFDIVDDLVDVV